MSRPQTYEQRVLCKANEYLDSIALETQNRIAYLESAVAVYYNFDANQYRLIMGYPAVTVDPIMAKTLLSHILDSGISFSMAISSLAREPLSVEEQKKNGAFYTDFRLANLLAEDCKKYLKSDSVVVDFAAGTGILLVAIANLYSNIFPDTLNEWMEKYLYAFDLSQVALRGAAVALLSVSGNMFAIHKMVSKWTACDSLLDDRLDTFTADIVVGNPPWGKIKLSRHSFIMQNGFERIYGSEYQDFNNQKFLEQKDALQEYAKIIKEKYDLLGKAEPDMYMAFLQKAILSVKDDGHVALLVPAGLIRSQGTKVLREYLISSGSDVEYNLIDNHANYFSIDSRFKFLLLSFTKKKQNSTSLEEVRFSVCKEQNYIVSKGEKISFNIELLVAARPDYTIPEVRSELEKELFFKIEEAGVSWGNVPGLWKAEVVREVDMTNDRKKFVKQCDPDSLPVIEGRMVQQHRFGAKEYISGTGRSAVWKPCISGIHPQFFCPKDSLANINHRIKNKRAGYCDIAGQTNERAMMSAVVPAGVVCGNKVPTIVFPNAPNDDLLYLWVGVTNSFTFDWMIRRIISTTVNYFLLFSIPMPNIDINSDLSQRIIECTKELEALGARYYCGNKMENLRAEIDVLVARAYNLSTEDIKLVLEDFPILDRKQPAIENEIRSTVTKDLFLLKNDEYRKVESPYKLRFEKAKCVGAKAYIPTEMADFVNEGGE